MDFEGDTYSSTHKRCEPKGKVNPHLARGLGYVWYGEKSGLVLLMGNLRLKQYVFTWLQMFRTFDHLCSFLNLLSFWEQCSSDKYALQLCHDYLDSLTYLIELFKESCKEHHMPKHTMRKHGLRKTWMNLSWTVDSRCWGLELWKLEN